MKHWTEMPYTQRLRWRVRLLWLAIAAMLVYMVVVAELGGGDSRKITRFADMVSDLLFFGGLVWLGCRITRTKKLLKNQQLRSRQRLEEQDERNRYLHDKTGGVVLDLLLYLLVLVTVTAGLFDTAAFYTAFSVLAAAVVLKGAAWWVYSRR